MTELKRPANHLHCACAYKMEAERDRYRELFVEALDELGLCDEDNPHVEVWCIRHRSKRCRVPELRAALSPGEETDGVSRKWKQRKQRRLQDPDVHKGYLGDV